MKVGNGRLGIVDVMLVAGLVAVATTTAALAHHNPGSNAAVSLFDPSVYSPDNRSSVAVDAASNQVNNVTVSLNGSSVIIHDPNVTLVTGTPDKCAISIDGHTATCTPTGTAPPVPSVAILLNDLADTLVNNAPIPSQSFDGQDFGPGFYADGGPGEDDLTGSSTADYLFGGLGSDTARGLGGNDSLDDYDDQDFDNPPSEVLGDDHFFGGEGDDFLDGGSGADELRGGTGTDDLMGGTGNNILDGGTGVDEAMFNIPPVFDANDDLVPPLPTDPGALVVLKATAPTTGNGLSGQNDTIVGIEDVLGTAGADNITGSAVGNDLAGLAGNDRIVGGAGPDRILGGRHANNLNAVDRGVDRIDCGGEAGGTATVDAIDQVLRCAGTDLTTVSARTITLNLRRHLVATGVLRTNGYGPCVSGAAVKIQKRRPEG